MSNRRRREGPAGLLLVDKPVGPTSREVAASVSRALGWPQAGHCGTLDPLASGLLVLVCGRATRVQDLLTGHDKEYVASVLLGAVSASDDGEGPVEEVVVEHVPAAEEVSAAVSAFTGRISQRPPALSAIRIDGKRAFKRVRSGETVEMPPRDVVIHEIAVTAFDYPHLELEVRCGAGTYIRSLARDLGETLGCGAYLNGLRRRRSGWFDVAGARLPESITIDALVTLEEALAPLPRVMIDAAALAPFLAGREVGVAEVPSHAEGELLAWSGGRVVARCRVVGEGAVRMKRLIVAPPGSGDAPARDGGAGTI